MREQRPVTIQAEREPLEIDLNRTAVLVIDMQNAFCKKGGMFDTAGRDISLIPQITTSINNINNAARANGVKVVYVVHRLTPDFREVGPLTPYRRGPNWDNPEIRRGTIIEGTWGTEIIDELKPREDEMVIVKRRYSAFSGTELDMMLRTYDIRYLIFVGVATNVCVESTLREAHHLQYYPVLVTDAVAATSPSRQQSSIDNIRDIFGWVTTSENMIKAFSG